MSIGDRLHAADRFQQRSGLRFLVAVLKKYTDDGAGQLAALIAYFGFFSLFPLLLVFVTILGFVLQGSPHDQQQIVHSTLSQFPIIGNQISSNVKSLRGSGVALAIGIVGALLAGLGITNAAQNAFNQIWHVPRRERPNFLKVRVRGLGLLAVFGVLSIVSTVIAGAVTAGSHGAVYDVVGILLAFLANLLLFFAVFRLLTVSEIETRCLWTGIVLAAVLWQILQHVGGYYVNHTLRHAKETYGLFATVIGLLAFLHLGAQVVILSAEVTVVRARKLYPRSFMHAPLTEADKQALTSTAEIEERVPQESVDVSFHDGAQDTGTPPAGSAEVRAPDEGIPRVGGDSPQG